MIGLGCAPFAGLYSAVDEPQAEATVHAALDVGIRLFDTAPHYGFGLSEERLGRALRGVPRDAFELETKVGRVLVDGAVQSMFDGAPPRHSEFDFSADGVRRSLESSLARLGVDRVDTVLLHDPDDHWQQAIDEAYPVLERWRAEGVVTRIGAGMNQSAMLARFARETDVDCFLVAGRWTLLDRSAGDDLLPACVERGREVLAAAVFNSGVLAGGTTFDYEPARASVLARVRALDSVCASHGVPLTAAALQWPLQHPAVTTVVVGARSPEEVRENDRLSRATIPDGLWAALSDL